ncbi:MAG: XylR N-terminal domain-containing protein, partial [Youngiibacter sp.]|nr:XylR N-terminal domain-containing protein [Youngiibacter sp.]
MKAKDMSFTDLFEFRKEEGEVYLKGQRSLILNVDALGTLRKDLIHNLGPDRAKAFLVRYGWQLGYNDGINLMRNHELDNEEELFKAGSVLFSMEGFAKVQNDIVIADKETKTFLKKGKFFNSFEAEQHLRHFGLSDKPVCWLLIGYASGYGTAFWGEKVYYVETKCRGNGDPHCEFEGRTLDDWGDRITSELSYYEDKTISEELNDAYKKIEDQNIQLERVLKTHQELSKLVLCGKGLAEITNNISRIIGHSVLLWDSNIDLVAFDQNIKEDRLNKITTVFHKELYGNTLINSAKPNDGDMLTDSLPLKKEVMIDNNIFWYALFPIISGETTYGYITVLEEDTLKLDKESLVL